MPSPCLAFFASNHHFLSYRDILDVYRLFLCENAFAIEPNDLGVIQPARALFLFRFGRSKSTVITTRGKFLFNLAAFLFLS
jgi:hypothetical protein